MADKNDPDIALMLRVKEGDLSAYEALVEKFKQPVMNLVYRLIHDLDRQRRNSIKPRIKPDQLPHSRHHESIRPRPRAHRFLSRVSLRLAV